VRQSNASIGHALISAEGTLDSLTGGAIGFAAGILIVNNFSWFFGYLGGQPQLSTRWMAMKSDKEVRTGAWIAIIWTVLAYAGAITLGLAAIALYGQSVVSDPEQILPFMLMKLMPPWLAGILLAGAVAAMMSTADSQLLIATSSVSEDVIHKALGKKLDDKTLVLVSRVVILVIGLAALGLAFTSKSLIYTIVHFAWAGIGCTFSPIVILSFFWKRFNASGVVASLVSGFSVTVLWMITGLDSAISATLITFFVSLTCAIVATKVSGNTKDS
jgi:sodium/proline symporter